MTLTELIRFVQQNGKTQAEQLRLLRKARARLLEEIHCKQQLLDQLDFMIYEMKRSNGRIL